MTRTLDGAMDPFKHYGFESEAGVERLYEYKPDPEKDKPGRIGKIWLGRADTERASPIGIADNRHMITVAGSRSGKGTTAIIPNLCLYPGSIICLDPKGENATLTAARRGRGVPELGIQGMGQKVIVLDPFNKAERHAKAYRQTFNPLSAIDMDSPEAIDQAADLADALVVISNEKDAHWDESARNLIKALILHIMSFDLPLLMGTDWQIARQENNIPLIPDLTILRTLLMRGSSDFATKLNQRRELKGEKLLSDFDGLLESMSQNFACGGAIQAAVGAFLSLGTNERGSILSTARRNTEFLDSPSIQANVSGRSSFHPKEVKEAAEGVTVYLCLPSAKLHTHYRWMRMILVSILGAAENPMNGRIKTNETGTGYNTLFILDEFAQLNRMDIIEKAAGLMAGYGLKLWVVLQDLTQLQRLYKESWETFFGNAGIVQFFGNTDITTLKYISEKIGRYRVNKQLGGRPAEHDVLTTSELEKLLCREENTLQNHQISYALQIVFLSGRSPLLLRKTEYFSRRESYFKNMTTE